MESNITLKSIISFLRSPYPMLVLLILILLFALFMFLLNRKNNKWLLWTSIPTVITSFIFFLIYLVGKPLLEGLINNDAEDLGVLINPFIDMIMGKFLLYSIILFVISAILIIVYYQLRKNKDNNTTTNKFTNETEEIQNS